MMHVGVGAWREIRVTGHRCASVGKECLNIAVKSMRTESSPQPFWKPQTTDLDCCPAISTMHGETKIYVKVGWSM